MKMAKRVFGFIKEKYNYFNFALLTLLLFLSCCFEPFVFVTVAYCVLISIVLPIESILQMILFTISFVLVFRVDNCDINIIAQINSRFSIYNAMWLMMTFVIGVKYLVDVFKKNKSINWKTLIPIFVFLLFVILPVHEAKIGNIAIYIGLLALLYLVFAYKRELSFTKLVLSLCLGIIVSSLFYLTKFISPRMAALLPIHYADNSSFIRFPALIGHPNGLAVVASIALSFLFVLWYRKQISLQVFIPIFVGTFIPAYLAISRNFIAAFGVLFLAFVILSLVKYKKAAFSKVGCLALVILIVIACCYYPTEVYFARFNSQIEYDQPGEQLPSESVELPTEPPADATLDDGTQAWWNGVYAGEIHYDPGRKGIWKMYLYDWTSSVKNILCGRGVSAKAIGQMAAHNTFIQLLWEQGVIGIILLLWVILSFVDFKKLKSSWDWKVLALLPIVVCAFFESFNDPMRLIPIIMLFTTMQAGGRLEAPKSDVNHLVSVIVPVYNVEAYLDRCLASIVKQTYQNLEIILVDDGSTDTCPQKCDEWAEKDRRIKVIHKKNGGLSDARNAGIDQATGDFLCFIDSDDFIYEQYVELLLSNLLATDSDLSACHWYKVDENTPLPAEVTNDYTVLEGDKIIDALFAKDNSPVVSACTKLYKKELFNDLRFDFGRINEDTLIAHKVLVKCKRVVLTNGQFYYYFNRVGSIMRASTFTERQLDDFIAYHNRYEYFKGTQFEGKALNQFVNSICYLYRLANSRNADAKILTFLQENFTKYYQLNQHKSFRQRVFAISPRLYCWCVKLIRRKN